MKKEFVEKLHQDFPNLYRNKIDIGVGNGWYSLIRDLSQKLENIILEDISKGVPGNELCRPIQIKEKFGSLRYYILGKTNDNYYKEIRIAEKISGETCENCGDKANNNYIYKKNHYWHLTLCAKCHEKRDNGKRAFDNEE